MIAHYGAKILIGLLLVVCMVEDIKYRRISLFIPTCIWIIVIIWNICLKDSSFLNAIGGIMVGIALFGISKVTKEEVGKGDALLFCVTGTELGLWKNISMLIYSLLFASIFSIILIMCKKAGRKQEIPFVPFMLAGYIGIGFL